MKCNTSSTVFLKPGLLLVYAASVLFAPLTMCLGGTERSDGDDQLTVGFHDRPEDHWAEEYRGFVFGYQNLENPLGDMTKRPSGYSKSTFVDLADKDGVYYQDHEAEHGLSNDNHMQVRVEYDWYPYEVEFVEEFFIDRVLLELKDGTQKILTLTDPHNALDAEGKIIDALTVKSIQIETSIKAKGGLGSNKGAYASLKVQQVDVDLDAILSSGKELEDKKEDDPGVLYGSATPHEEERLKLKLHPVKPSGTGGKLRFNSLPSGVTLYEQAAGGSAMDLEQDIDASSTKFVYAEYDTDDAEGVAEISVAWWKKGDDPSSVDPTLENADTVALLPIEVRVSDRDDIKNDWSNARVHSQDEPIFAGRDSGDMVVWELLGEGLGSETVTWSASGPNGEEVTGPSGKGEVEWAFRDGDEEDADWLSWVPGTWKIKVEYGDSEVEFEQEVGWRTECVLVIGQIVPTFQFPDPPDHGNPADPLFQEPGNKFRLAMLTELFTGFPFTPFPVEALALAPVGTLNTRFITMAWFGRWSMDFFTPPSQKGPFTAGQAFAVVPKGRVTEDQRFWMIQHLLNTGSDEIFDAQKFNEIDLTALRISREFRILHRFQARFTMDGEGRIEKNSVTAIDPIAEAGTTKVNFSAKEDDFYPGSPPFNAAIIQDEPEISSHNGELSKSDRFDAFSGYASARVGINGRKANWRLFGRDAPWIFSEILTFINESGSPETRIRLSVDMLLKEKGSKISGTANFNNLSIYERSVNSDGEINYRLKELLPMEGQLKPFVESASGSWPEAELPPAIK